MDFVQYLLNIVSMIIGIIIGTELTQQILINKARKLLKKYDVSENTIREAIKSLKYLLNIPEEK